VKAFHDDGSESLESGASHGGIIEREKEISLPEPLSRDGAVGLTVDCEEQAGRIAFLGDPLGDDEHVTIRISINGARSQRFIGKLNGIIIGAIFGSERATRS